MKAYKVCVDGYPDYIYLGPGASVVRNDVRQTLCDLGVEVGFEDVKVRRAAEYDHLHEEEMGERVISAGIIKRD